MHALNTTHLVACVYDIILTLIYVYVHIYICIAVNIRVVNRRHSMLNAQMFRSHQRKLADQLVPTQLPKLD